MGLAIFEDAVHKSTTSVFGMFGLDADLQRRQDMKYLTSGSAVNILVGFAGGLRGNVVIGCSHSAGLILVSRMMGGMDVELLDHMAQSALGELCNMVVGNAMMDMQSDNAVHLTPPTLLIGEDPYLLISKVKSTQLVYSLGGESLIIACSVE